MMYKAHLIQDGEGCDYTIGCGITVFDLDAKDMQSAIIELEGIIRETYSHDESRLEIVKIYEVSQVLTANMGEFYRKIEEEKVSQAQLKKWASERAEYERLRKIFEGK